MFAPIKNNSAIGALDLRQITLPAIYPRIPTLKKRLYQDQFDPFRRDNIIFSLFLSKNEPNH